jgi:hypothetical protein
MAQAAFSSLHLRMKSCAAFTLVVKVLAAPFRNTAHRDLRRFHQQTLSWNQSHSLTSESMKHDQKACPLCRERIEKTARGGRRNIRVRTVGQRSTSCSFATAAEPKECGKATRERLAAVAVRRTLDNW